MKKIIGSGSFRLLIVIVLSVILGNMLIHILLPSASLVTHLRGIIAIILFTLIVSMLAYLSISIGNSRHGEKMRLAYNVLETSNEAILITDDKVKIEYVNPTFCDITGYAIEEVIGKNPSIMKSGRHDSEFYKDMWNSLRTKGQWKGEIWDRRKNGEVYPKWLSISTITDKKGRVIKYVGVFSDITAIKQTEEQLEHMAHYDALTNLPNRILFRDRLKQAIARTERYKGVVGIMFLDLDRFKNINDSLGHPSGDLLLKEVAQRLSGCVRKNDTVARMGGDEFAIVLPEIENEQSTAIIAKKIINEMSRPFSLKGYNVFINISIGITLYPLDGEEIDTLLKNADMAMYLAKEEGNSKFQFYNPKMSASTFEHLSIETNLHYAFERGEFVLLYQPQVNLHTGEVVGMEALIRRQQANWLVPPSMFIHLAEEVGLIVPICEWTLIEACKQNKLWQEERLRPLRVSVNISAYQFNHNRLVTSVKHVLEETRLNPEYLELELTERIIMRDISEAIKTMRELKDMGVSLAIDDFGTGYSSLNYLRKLPIDKLKIDISFIKDIPNDPDSISIAKAIIALAHSLQLRVMAEGVENERQLSFLMENNCDEIQGYYFSVPLPAKSFKEMVKSNKRLETIRDKKIVNQ